MDTIENATNAALSISDGRATFTLMEDGVIECEYASGVSGYWESYEDMMGDRDLATKFARKIRRQRDG